MPSTIKGREVRVTVPGKVMLSGEYGVLFNEPALASTVNTDCVVHVRASEDQGSKGRITFRSEFWSEPQIHNINELMEQNEPLLAGVGLALEKLGIKDVSLEVSVDRCFDVRHGFGSSSALRLAGLAGVLSYFDSDYSPEQLLLDSFLSLRAKAPNSSGYDFCTQVYGGLVQILPEVEKPLFLCSPKEIATKWPNPTILDSSQLLETLNEYAWIYSGGEGAPTGPTVGKFFDYLSYQENGGRKFIANLRDYSLEQTLCWNALVANPSDETFGYLIDAIRSQRDFLFQAVPFESRNLEEASLFGRLRQVSGFDKSWTCKPTGAGGQDSVLVVARPEKKAAIDAAMQERGWKNEFIFAEKRLGVEAL